MQENKEKRAEGSVSYKAVGKRRPSRMGKYIALIFLLLASCFGAGIGGGYAAVQLGILPSSIDRGVVHDGNAIISEDEEDIAAVASKVGPSVVSITTTVKTQTFYGDQLQRGAGSGIVITKDGYILTNKHVVAGSDKVRVTTSDGRVFEDAKVVGRDPLNDIAFVKLDGVDNLKPAELGDSSSIRIGQKVVAIGNSLGQFQNTVTSGIISGVGRPIVAQGEGNQPETLTDLIQTDAAINPGNSGGPLVNLSGQVIGINTAIAEDAEGVGFTIPINSAKGIIKNLSKTGKIERSYLGVRYTMITPKFADKYNLSIKQGAYVATDKGESVVEGSPADKAGIKKKDIITKVNDLEVGSRGSLSSLVSEYAPGDTIKLTVLRGDKEIVLDVTLAAYHE